MGALLGDDVVEAGPGDLVFKPRGQSAHVLERRATSPRAIRSSIIAPGRLRAVLRRAGDRSSAGGAPDPEVMGELCARYAARHAARERLPGSAPAIGLWFPGVA